MNYIFCNNQFNQGIDKRRTNPKADGGPCLDTICRTGEILLSGISELNYRLRNGLKLQSYHQDDDDAHWATEVMGNIAYQLGYEVVPAMEDLARTSSGQQVKQVVSKLKLRIRKLIHRMDAACDALWEHGLSVQNASWLADDSELFRIAMEYNQIIEEARALA